MKKRFLAFVFLTVSLFFVAVLHAANRDKKNVKTNLPSKSKAGSKNDMMLVPNIIIL